MRLVGVLLLLLVLHVGDEVAAAEIEVNLPNKHAYQVVSLHNLDVKKAPVPLHTPAVLHQKKRVFEPHMTVVPLGSIIDMTNDDDVYHNVFSLSQAKSFDLGLYPHGDHKSVLFDKPGEVKVFCAVHPQMHAVVLVMDTPWYVDASDQDKVMFREVPAGRYAVRLWRKNESPQVIDEVRITTDGFTRIDFGSVRP